MRANHDKVLGILARDNAVFGTAPIHDFVEDGYFGVLSLDLVKDLPKDDEFPGLQIVDAPLDGAVPLFVQCDFAKEVAEDSPDDCLRAIVGTLMQAAAIDMIDEEGVEGPEGGIPTIERQIGLKVGHGRHEEDTFTLCLRVMGVRT